MSIESKTHTFRKKYFIPNCADCGIEIPDLPGDQPRPRDGDKIGVIRTQHTNPVAYRVGIHDSNLPCTVNIPES